MAAKIRDEHTSSSYQRSPPDRLISGKKEEREMHCCVNSLVPFVSFFWLIKSGFLLLAFLLFILPFGFVWFFFVVVVNSSIYLFGFLLFATSSEGCHSKSLVDWGPPISSMASHFRDFPHPLPFRWTIHEIKSPKKKGKIEPTHMTVVVVVVAAAAVLPVERNKKEKKYISKKRRITIRKATPIETCY